MPPPPMSFAEALTLALPQRNQMRLQMLTYLVPPVPTRQPSAVPAG